MESVTKVKGKISFRLNSPDIGVDLGTANTIVFLKGQGIVLEEPSVVAIHAHTKELLAVGEEAKAMIGKTPSNIMAIRPLQDGVIADFNITKMMLKYYISKAFKGRGLGKPRVIVGVPLGITQVESRAIIEACHQAGGREAYLIEEPIAAALGAGLSVAEPHGHMIVDIGGGTTEIAVISLGGVVVGKSLRSAGYAINQGISDYMKRKYNLEVGDRTAEQVKIQIAYATDTPASETYGIKGKDLATGLPANIDIIATEITESITKPINSIIDTIRATLEKTPPELAADIMETGMILTGGGALLKNIDVIINRATNLPVTIADDPLSCVARGTGRALENIHLYIKIYKNN